MSVLEKLYQAADATEAARMSAYMKNHFRFLGIATPKRRLLTKDFIKTQKVIDWDFIFKCWALPEREFQYLALDLLKKLNEQLDITALPRLKQLLTTKSWWDSVDSLADVVGAVALREEAMADILLEWSRDANIWLRRTAIEHQLQFREKTKPALLEKILLNNLDQQEFFIKKAVGTALRDYSKTDPEWVRCFIDRYQAQLLPLSLRIARKYL